jgi:phosphodiesterase/alkaline phosphatase D-like protein
VLLLLALALAALSTSSSGVLSAQAGGSCAAATNPVVCENQLPGNPASEWEVAGSGDASIQGFATDISVNRGQTVSFKIRTSANYRVDIYRLGYYGGLGARKVATVQPTARNQPACLNDPSTGLVDCGNWAVSASWLVPTTAVSGVYVARPVRTDTGGASHILFVVRDDTGSSDLLFQTSDTTWHAYNSYGGNSLYTGAPANRAFKVSYNRPFNNRDIGGGVRESYFFSAEYPMVRWLEASGYDVSYFAGVDTLRRGAEIREHKAFLSVGHDEYWSAEQRSAVEAARDAGVNLAFFSANEVFWKTRWEPSIDGTSTPNRTMVCYKETLAEAKIDPVSGVWTGTWRDPRFSPPADGGRPENGLTGQLFMVNGIRDDAITVPAADGRLRFWRNTEIATLPLGEVAQLPLGTLGYEWDVDVENAARPAGLIRMSSTTWNINTHYLLDYGSSYGAGTATHSLTLYKHSSGALVFGAGTVQWSWGLDSTHDGRQEPADRRMQQATVNLFADMGAQPLTLASGLVAATPSLDATAPTAAVTSPASGGFVEIGKPITITGTATDSGGGVVAAIEVSIDGGATWKPAVGRQNWSFVTSFSSTGNRTIRSRAVDDSGNIQAVPTVTPITVNPDVTAPTIANVRVASAFSTWASVTWTTDEPADGQAQFGATAQYGNATPVEPSYSTTHVASIGGLQPNSTYHFRVLSRDPYGNLAASSDVTLTTTDGTAVQVLTFDDRPGEEQPLDGEFPAGVINWGTATWWHSAPWGGFTTKSIAFANSWTTTAPMTFVNPIRILRLEAYNGGDSTTTVTVTCPTQATVQVAVPAGQVRTIATGWAQACSSATIGSSNSWSTNFDNIEFDAPPDTVAPDITGVGVQDIEAAGATISWSTNEPATSQVDYGVSSGYGSSSPLDSTLTMSHGVTIGGLSPNTTYFYRVRSRDAAGNLRLSAGSSFTTGPPDATAPVVSGLQLTRVTETSARLTWQTNERADTQVEFGLTTSYGTLTSLDPALLHGHLVTLNGLAAGTTYHYRVRSRDGSGNLALTADRTFTTAAPGTCPCTVWPSTATPSIPSQNDSSAVELGMRFRADQNGFINGLRFYKGVANTGSHVAHLWTNAGVLLATATFDMETASGWQEAAFPSPVAITANTTYVASYYAPNGGYAVTPGGFNAPVDAPPLHALRQNVDGPNGAYHYGASGFPTSTYDSANYWVDVVYVPAPDVTAPSITNIGTTVTMTSATVSWTTDEAADGQIQYGLSSSYGSASSLATALTTGHSIVLTGLTQGTTYHFRVLTRDGYGNTASSADATFTTDAPDGTPPVSSSIQATLVTNSSARISWVTNELADTQVQYGLTSAYGTTTPLDSTLAIGHAVALTGLNAGSTYHYRVLSRDAAGNMSASADMTFRTSGAGACPCSIWPLTATPAVTAGSDSTALEVGVRFRADQDGLITGVRFYKGAGNTGVHVGHLWANDGTALATATFTNETASGWQEVAFASPVAVSANTTYVASYYAPNGHYAQSTGGLGSAVLAPPLRALGDGTDGGNGVYRYGSTGFPNSSWGSSNYWVDVVFVPASDLTAPAIQAVEAATGPTSATVTWTTTEPADGQVEFGLTASHGSLSTLAPAYVASHSIVVNGLSPSTTYHFSVRSRDQAGNLATSADATFVTQPGDATPPVLSQVAATLVTQTSARVSWVSNEAADTQVEYGPTTAYGTLSPLDSTLITGHVVPLNGLAVGTTYYYRVRSRDAAGNLAQATGSFATAAAGGCPCSLWPVTATPAIASSGDSSAVELGVRFRADSNGYITGLRFYKGAANTGVHVANLWTDTGTLLATATFTNETATGWQEVAFSSPVAVTANTNYVASYFAPTGGYAQNSDYFYAALNAPPLQAPADGASGGNGLYRYGPSGFPTFAYRASNYWVDVVFTTTP